ncbi:MAG: hypothetical protein AAFO83_00180 [Cyanobacteria bacterium J06607_13]
MHLLLKAHNFGSDFITTDGNQVVQFNSSAITVTAKAGCRIDRVLASRWKPSLSKKQIEAISKKNRAGTFSGKALDKSGWDYFCEIDIGAGFPPVFSWVDASLVGYTTGDPTLVGMDRFTSFDAKPAPKKQCQPELLS